MNAFLPMDQLGRAGVALGLAVSGLLLLKTYGVARSMLWAYLHGKDYAQDLLAQIPAWKTLGYGPDEFAGLVREHRDTWGTARGERPALVQVPLRALHVFGEHWVYRWPSLLLLQVGVLVLTGNRMLLAAGVAVLLAALWVEILHVLTHRLTMGCMDTYFRRGTPLGVPVTPPAGAACPSRGDLLRDFARLFIWLMAMVIVGYAGVFSGLQALVPGGAFRGLDGSWAPLQFLYFSVVTIATVGYGDILPASTAARLITASEVLAGLSLLVFLMTAFTMTMEPDHPPA